MFLLEKRPSPFSHFFSNPKKQASAAARIAYKPFEETLITRLSSLLPFPDSSSPSIPLPYLSRAIDLLTLTLADLSSLLADPSLPPADPAALSSLLDSSAALLHACNALSSALDRILRRRLLPLRLALRLLDSSPPSPDRLRRARAAIAEWDGAAAPRDYAADLARLRPRDPNRGRLTSVRRAVYAVEAIADLVARSAFAVLGEEVDFLVGVRRVSGEFGWAAAYNEVAAKVCRGGIAGEIEAVTMSARKLAVAVEGDGGGGGVTEAVRGAEEAMEELTEGMDRLADGVNALFRGALETREAALQCFRVGQGRCN